MRIYQQRAKDVMCQEVVTVDPGDTVHSALKLMVENQVSALPVVDRHNVCVGMISSSDIVELTKDIDEEFESLEETGTASAWLAQWLVRNTTHESIEQIMSVDVASVGPDALLSSVASKMLRNRVHRVPVVDSHGRLLGLVSTTDIMAAFADSALPEV
ncbi:MAG: CBS domain-containing protein [Planctomycetales bacterium]|nr:CBS domain-containing protein [Planctomycetales bacterium]